MACSCWPVLKASGGRVTACVAWSHPEDPIVSMVPTGGWRFSSPASDRIETVVVIGDQILDVPFPVGFLFSNVILRGDRLFL